MNDSGPDWVTALATIAAVIVGGGITWWIQWLAAKRFERGQAKVAARMIQVGIATAASRLKDMIEEDARWFGFYDLTVVAWTDHAPVLALHLAAEDWESV